MFNFLKKLFKNKKTEIPMKKIELINKDDSFFEPSNYILFIDPDLEDFNKSYFVNDVIEINGNYFILYGENKKINKDLVGEKFIYVPNDTTHYCRIIDKVEEKIDRELFKPKVAVNKEGEEVVIPPLVSGNPEDYDKIYIKIKIEKQEKPKQIEPTTQSAIEPKKEIVNEPKKEIVIEPLSAPIGKQQSPYIEMFKKIKTIKTGIEFKINLNIPSPPVINNLMDNLNIDDNEKDEILNEYIDSIILENQKEFLNAIKIKIKQTFLKESFSNENRGN